MYKKKDQQHIVYFVTVLWVRPSSFAMIFRVSPETHPYTIPNTCVGRTFWFPPRNALRFGGLLLLKKKWSVY